MQSNIIKTDRFAQIGGKKAVSFLLPIIGEILFFVFLGLFLKWMNPAANIVIYQEGPQLCMVLGTITIVLLITGLLPYFFKSILYGFGQTDSADRGQLAKCLLSVKTAILAALLSGLLATAVSVIDILSRSVTEGTEHIGLFLSVAGTGLLYGIIVTVLLMPLYIRLKAKTL